MCARVMMILLITRRASKAPDMRSRSQRVAKSFFFSLSLSLSLSLGGSNLFFEGKNASGKDFNVSKRHVYESLNNEFYRSKLPEDA